VVSGREPIRFAFAGDVCLALGARDTLDSFGTNFLFAGLTELLTGTDIRIGNLECVIVDQTCERDALHEPMAVDRSLIDGLRGGPFNHYSLANNHIMDCGPSGLRATQRALAEMEIGYFGAAETLDAAERLQLIKAKGWTVGVVAGCDVTRSNAADDRAGTAPADPERLVARIKEARQLADIVVVILHADLEFSRQPQPWRVRLSRQLADSGADLVIQHHPHVCQAVETHGNCLIAYSLGNCVFQISGNDYLAERADTRTGFVLCVQVSEVQGRKQLDWDARPISIDDQHRPVALHGLLRDQWLVELGDLSLALSDPERLRQYWLDRCREEARIRFGNIYWSLRRARFRDALQESAHVAMSSEERRWLKGLLSGGRV
jgi:poly-gamma-glutamate synthesis protein (capsule biosynthesis protein)